MDKARALALTVLAAVLWGTSFPANDIGLAATDAWTFMLVRFGLAFAASAGAAMLLGGLDASWLRNKWVWAVGLANALSYQLQFLGQELTSPGAAALMVNTGNLAVPLFAWLVHRERVRGAKAPALALAAAGVFLVGTRGDLQFLARSEFLGNMLTLAAGLSFALVIVLNKAAVEGRGLLSLVTWITGLTTLFGLPGALLLGSGELPGQALLAASYAGLVCTTLAFLVWSAALRHTSSVVSGLVLLLEVLVALALGFALGLERLDLAVALGAACLLASFALAARAEAPTAPLPEGAEAPPATTPRE